MKKIYIITTLLILFVPLRVASQCALTNSIAAYWSFNSNAGDAVNSNNGTIYGPVSQTGRISNAYSFPVFRTFLQHPYNAL